MLTALLLTVACKKDPEPTAKPVDVATSITVKVPEGTEGIRVVCKDTGTNSTIEVGAEEEVLVEGVTGDDCRITFLPSEDKFGPVTGGESYACVRSEGTLGCKSR